MLSLAGGERGGLLGRGQGVF